MRDITNNLKAVPALSAAVYTSDQTGATINRAGFAAVEHVITVGVSGDALSGTVYYDFIIEESDDDSAWSAVTAAAAVIVGPDGVSAAPNGSGVFATIDAAAEDDKILRIGYVGGKQYSRIRVDFTGTHTNGTPMSAHARLGFPDNANVSD